MAVVTVETGESHQGRFSVFRGQYCVLWQLGPFCLDSCRRMEGGGMASFVSRRGERLGQFCHQYEEITKHVDRFEDVPGNNQVGPMEMLETVQEIPRAISLMTEGSVLWSPALL